MSGHSPVPRAMGNRENRKVSSYLPTVPTLGKEISEKAGQPVITIETLPVAANDVLDFQFVSAASPHPQGAWVAVDGELEVAGLRQKQFTLWKETAPPVVSVRIVRADPAFLWMYNVYWSGRQRISLMRWMGMVKKEG